MSVSGVCRSFLDHIRCFEMSFIPNTCNITKISVQSNTCTFAWCLQNTCFWSHLNKIPMQASERLSHTEIDHYDIEAASSQSSRQHSSSTISNFPPPPRKFIRKQDGTARTSSARSEDFAERLEFMIACKLATGREIVNAESAKWGELSQPSASRRECSRAG